MVTGTGDRFSFLHKFQTADFDPTTPLAWAYCCRECHTTVYGYGLFQLACVTCGTRALGDIVEEMQG